MDSQERILTVFNGAIPDQVPVMELSMDNKNIADHYGGKLALGLEFSKIKWFERIPGWRYWVSRVMLNPKTYEMGTKIMIDLASKMKFDACVIPIVLFPIKNMQTGEQRNWTLPHINEYIDEFGRFFRWTPTGYGFDTNYYLDGALTSEELYNKWGPLEPHNPIRMRTYNAAKKAVQDNAGHMNPFIIPAIGGISEVTWEALGMRFFAKCIRARKEFISRVSDDRKNFAIEVIKDLAQNGAKIVIMYDDYGYKTGPLVNPKDFHSMFMPRMKEIVSFAHEKNIKILLHSCGNLNEIFPDIIEMGIDALHPIEPTAYMDIFALKKQYPNLVFVGNVSPQDLQDKTPDFIREYTTRLMNEVKPGGHFILTSGHSINPAVKLENYLAMREVHEKLGKY